MPGPPKNYVGTASENDAYVRYLQGDPVMEFFERHFEALKPIRSPRPITMRVDRLSDDTRRELKMNNSTRKIRIEPLKFINEATVFNCFVGGCGNKAAVRVFIGKNNEIFKPCTCPECAVLEAEELLMACGG